MTRQQRIGALAATMLLLLGSAGAALAVDLNLTPSVVGFHNPIGVDFQDISGKLILTANYPTGLPNNLELVDPGTGVAVPFSALVGLTNELKVATVRAGNCQGDSRPASPLPATVPPAKSSASPRTVQLCRIHG